MKKINNPFSSNDPNSHKCFGCSPFNKSGLHLEFYEEDEDMIAFWLPEKVFEGYTDVLHGGIQATLLDEIASWVVYVKCQTSGVTAEINIRYKNPVLINGTEVKLKARILSRDRRLVTIKAELYSKDDVLCSEAEIRYFLFPQKIAKEKYYYPGVEAFYIN
ncbi:MAG TPA: PaaI family thioesterase [Williamwhitmania sp.]|nr:PaaI family thioesterase [Williamwhitmania sp.]